jgi:hypothetical protein
LDQPLRGGGNDVEEKQADFTAKTGSTLTFFGFTLWRRPMALVFELIRQKRRFVANASYITSPGWRVQKWPEGNWVPRKSPDCADCSEAFKSKSAAEWQSWGQQFDIPVVAVSGGV